MSDTGQHRSVGPNDLSTICTSLVANYLICQKTAIVVEEQANVDVSMIGADLSDKISAFQGRMKKQAVYVSNVMIDGPDYFIALIVSIQNLCQLVIPGLGLSQPDLSMIADNRNARVMAAQVFSALASQASDIQHGAEALASRASATKEQLDQYATDYRQSLEAAENALQAGAKDALADIDALTRRIKQSIQAIAAGGVELGAAVTVGILAVIASEDGTADLAVTAIKGGVAGVEKMSEAVAELNADNEKLAAAYQRLASDQMTLAVAKVVEVQSALFVSALSAALKETQNLVVEMSLIHSEFSSFANAIQASAGNAAEAETLASAAQDAGPQWAALAQRFPAIKASIVSLGL